MQKIDIRFCEKYVVLVISVTTYWYVNEYIVILYDNKYPEIKSENALKAIDNFDWGKIKVVIASSRM